MSDAAKPEPAIPAQPTGDERFMHLSTEDGVESWLDFQSGRVETRPIKDFVKPAQALILQSVRHSLQEEKIHYQDYDSERITAGFKGTHGRYHVFVTVHETARRFAVWTAYGAKSPVHRLEELEELLTRINKELDRGDIVVDRESGDIFVKALCVVGKKELGGATVPIMMRFVVETADRWQLAIMRVLFGGLSAQQVLAEEGAW